MLPALKLLAEQFHSFLMTVTGMSTDRCCMAQQEGAACRWWNAYVWQGFVVTSCWSHMDGH
jgi:hypothetical protein